VTFLTEYAVVAAPVVLVLHSVVLWCGKTVRVEALTAKVAAKEVLLISEGSA
jgi:hypothetical protein